MELQSLVLSEDTKTVKVLRRLLEELEISFEHCPQADMAMELLARRKFDGVFADCDIEGSSQLLKAVRRSRTNQRSIVFAILTGNMSVRQAFELGANFVLYKPVSVERAKRSLRAAHGMMMRERRRHFRHPMDSRVYLNFDRVKDLQATILDLSSGGMAIKTMEPLVLRHEVHMRFALPGNSLFLEGDGQVAWVDSFGRAGLQFTILPPDSQSELDKWLLARATITQAEEALVAPKTAEESRPREEMPPPAMAAEVPAEAPSVMEQEVEIEVVPPDAPALTHRRWREDKSRTVLRGETEGRILAVVIRAGKVVVVRGRCEDLSEEGLGGEMEGEFLLGDPVLIQLTLPHSEEPLRVHAEVRHRTESYYGFEFVALDAAQRRVIRKFCEALPVRG
jgi:CheY-like chemotaxis protein